MTTLLSVFLWELYKTVLEWSWPTGRFSLRPSVRMTKKRDAR